MNMAEFEFRPSEGFIRLMRVFAAAGVAAFGAGLLVAPQRIWPDLLMASYLLAGLGLAGIFFVALQYASGAGWSVSFRRVPEAMSAVLPYAALGLAIVFIFRPSLYPWLGDSAHGAFKHAWLNLPFFLARAALYLLVWIVFAFAIVRVSRRQDRDGDVAHTIKNVRLSVIFLVVFAITFWLASYDWIMSLEPDWYSTIFGVYNFAGLFSSGLAALILLVLWLRRSGPLHDFVNEEHLHDLGKLLFAFCTFWMYIWFSQYMLIWYADISEETIHFVRRQHEFWQPLFLLNMFLNWAIPFTILLPRAAKRSAATLAKVAVVVLLGRCLDLYLMIIPPFAGPNPAFGVWEVALLLGAFGVFVLVFIRALRQAPPVPIRDPYVMESLHYHN
jgi:hypothetical protein